MKKIGLLGDKSQQIEFWRSLNLNAEFISADWKTLSGLSGLDGVFVDPILCASLLTELREMTREIKAIGYFDFLEKTKFGLSPVSLLRQYGAEMIRSGVASLDVRKIAYVTGSNAWSRIFAILAAQLGFKKVIFVVKTLEENHQLLADLSAIAFGVEFSSMLESELTLQPNNASLLINTVAEQEEPALISDLSYLNYLSLSGLVIDVHESNLKSLLIEETRNSKITLIDGFTVQSFLEYWLLNKQTGLLTSSFGDYVEKRKSFLMK